ncbi:MAG: hypothetical protein D4R88_08000 [Methanosarcinales archaeon]|nr:MAG: hypothetical protein D4R88_08000 [Methanosarcinales archaeon]
MHSIFMSSIHLVREILSEARYQFYRLSSIEVYGIQIDVFLHFLTGGLIFYLCRRRYPVIKSLAILTVLILSKEVIDVFAHSELRYIQNPRMDTFWDVVTSYAGAVVVYMITQRKIRAEAESA